MKLRLTAPSKTFLVGEYAILYGGHALLANTEPRFEVIISTPGEGRCENIHPNSPAGQWARTHREAFEKIDFQFIDPHQGRGGFGASSAQFLLAWAWSLLDQVPFSKLTEGLDLSQILKDYHSLFEEASTRPSGGDVIAQSMGGLCQVATKPLSMTEKSWPFKDLDFLIIPTGKKINTHKHLKELSDTGIGELKDVSQQVCLSLAHQQSQGFIDGINNYAQLLKEQEKVIGHTKTLLKTWKEKHGVVAGKGCGALGADSFVLFVEADQSLNLRQQLGESGFPVLASSLSLSQGLGLQLNLQEEVKPMPMKLPFGN